MDLMTKIISVSIQPEVQELNRAPKVHDERKKMERAPLSESSSSVGVHAPTPIEANDSSDQATSPLEDSDVESEESGEEREITSSSTQLPPQEASPRIAVPSTTATAEGAYNLRERKPVDYNPLPQLRRPLAHTISWNLKTDSLSMCTRNKKSECYH